MNIQSTATNAMLRTGKAVRTREFWFESWKWAAATVGFASLYLLLISQVGDLVGMVTDSVSDDVPWVLVTLLHLIVGVSPAAAAWAALRVFLFPCRCETLGRAPMRDREETKNELSIYQRQNPAEG